MFNLSRAFPAVLAVLLTGAGCANRSTGVAFSVYDIRSRSGKSVLVEDGVMAARFCGCPPCVREASALPPAARSRFKIVTFDGPAESLVEFSEAVSWPELNLVEMDRQWHQAWTGKSCPLFGVWSDSEGRFVQVREQWDL